MKKHTSAQVHIITLLNVVLAHMIDFKLQAKQAHWNVKGEQFMTLHALFDQLAEAADEHADALAERAVQLEGIALGTLSAVSKASSLPAYDTKLQESKKHLEALESAMTLILTQTAELTRIAADSEDDVTADLATSVSASLSKLRWFVRAHT